MPDANDMELLQDYSRHGSETAFAELVQRHINLVYSVALRHVGNTAHAEEITQAVFIILARKAASLRRDTILEGWLHETTRLTALSFMRGERRRQFREQEAYMQSTLNEPGTGAAIWNQLAPLLDEAMARLGKKDRDAVLMRFFKDKSVREVASATQTSEAAAQRRILRALGKLHRFFTKRGVSSTTAIIAGVMAAHSVQAAPVALAKSVTAVAVAKGTTASVSTLALIQGALKIMAWSKMKTTAVVSVVVILAAGTTGLAIKHQRQAYNSMSVADVGSGEPLMQSFQGHWTGSNTAHPGETCTLNLSGDQFEYRGTEPNDWVRGKFVLNENTNPKQMDVTIAEPVSESGKTILIIYQSAADKITLAAGPHGSGQRPADFTPGPQVDVLEFQHD
jgi:RNA polymerase sigma factor (sigma-70 family)